MHKCYEEQARTFCDAIRYFAGHEDAIDNMERYLSYHFAEWLEKFAYDSDSLSAEVKLFAHLYDSEEVNA